MYFNRVIYFLPELQHYLTLVGDKKKFSENYCTQLQAFSRIGVWVLGSSFGSNLSPVQSVLNLFMVLSKSDFVATKEHPTKENE